MHFINKLRPYLVLFLSVFGVVHSQAILAQDASEFELSIEIPKMSVAEYHAPYIATWIEGGPDGETIGTSLWYDDQEKWLKDIRRWWRKTGRTQEKPYDGVTGATRRPGSHQLKLQGKNISQKLTAGNYVLFIEASREVGGREVLKLPFTWPAKQQEKIEATGDSELGKVSLTLTPVETN